MTTKLASLALILAAFLTSCASSGGGAGSAASSTLTGAQPYPLKVCLVTDNDLDSMGDQQVHTYQGRQLKFCCDPCWQKFQKNPAKYLAKLN